MYIYASAIEEYLHHSTMKFIIRCCFMGYINISQQEQQIEIIDNEGRQKQVKENTYGSCEYIWCRLCFLS